VKFKDLGWNNFLFEIPQDARLTSEGGNAKSGYVRIEGENYFFEIRWEQAQPKKVKPMSEVVSAFVKKLEKESKQKIPIRGRRPTNIFTHNALFLSLKSDVEERIYFWYCQESLRIIIFRFVFKSMTPTSRTIMNEALTSLRCHGEETNKWTVFESSFKVPPSFQVAERKMMVGRTYLLLVERKFTPFSERKREILYEYFSMANIQFEGEYEDPAKWMETRHLKDLKKRYKGIKFQSFTKEKLNDHAAIVKKGEVKSGYTTHKSSLYTNVTWYCEDMNRIYSVTISEQVARPLPLKLKVDKNAFEDLSKEFISTIKCH